MFLSTFEGSHLNLPPGREVAGLIVYYKASFSSLFIVTKKIFDKRIINNLMMMML